VTSERQRVKSYRKLQIIGGFEAMFQFTRLAFGIAIGALSLAANQRRRVLCPPSRPLAWLVLPKDGRLD
jgi:hypothetical protein